LILSDFFTGTPFVVEVEKDLSARKQLLDVIIVRRTRGRLKRRPPDGLDNLTDHNLVTFKSHHEALDDWTLKELTGHYVNYRKQVGPSMNTLLPEEQFGLYAVCSRFPQGLASQIALEELNQGVYACRRGSDLIRIIVAAQLAREEHNAPLHLFSARLDEIQYGRGHYRRHSEETSSLLQTLLAAYQQEGVFMAYTMQDFRRDVMKEEWAKLSPEERKALLNRLPPEERLQGIPPEQLLKRIPPEQRLQGIPPEQRLEGLSTEEIEKYLNRRKRAGTAKKRRN